MSLSSSLHGCGRSVRVKKIAMSPHARALILQHFLLKLTFCCRNGAIRLENTCIDLDGQAEFETKKLTVGLISLKGMKKKPTKGFSEPKGLKLLKYIFIKSCCPNVQPFGGRLEAIIGSKIKRCLKDSLRFNIIQTLGLLFYYVVPWTN